MDNVNRRVASIVYREVARAYGHTPEHQRDYDPVCEHCDGDGCERCDFTGEPK